MATGVDLQACQTTMELMDYDEREFYDDVTTGVGAATELEHVADADTQLLTRFRRQSSSFIVLEAYTLLK